MGFAGKVWRLLVGIKDALALLFLLLFFLALFAILSARPNPGLVRDGALLLKLDGVVVEEKSAIDPISALLARSLPTQEYASRDLVRAIDAAAGDDRIEAIALDLSTFLGGGQVHMQEVGAALDRFRQADKPVIAYAVAYTDDAIMLAAHASEVWIDPMGGAVVRGPGGNNLYYGAALERFNIQAKVYRVGTYKSAVEPYLQNEMSEPARENAEAYVSSLWEEWQANVKTARPKIDLDATVGGYAELVEAANGDMAQVALRAGLADRVGTYEEWGKRVAQVAGEDEWDDLPGSFASTDLEPWLADIEPSAASGFTGGAAQIGVVTIAGTIGDDTSGPGSAGAARIEKLLDDALDSDLKALVLRIDSPGGTVTGSETIRRAIMRHKAKNIPIVASFGNMAASGGYWVATPADTIVAEPESLTGSIGVFLAIPTFENLLAEYGVTSDGVQTTPLSGQPDLLAGFTPEVDALLQSETEATYIRFLNLVANSRGISRAKADELAQGRVGSGGAARQLGLVDRFGDLDTALELAAEAAQLGEGEWEPLFLGQDADPYAPMITRILGGEAERSTAPSLSATLTLRREDLAARIMSDLDLVFGTRGVQAMCLECPTPVRPVSRIEKAGLWQGVASLFLVR